MTMADNRFVDCPGALHNLGGSFAFADGHCEHKRWQDWRTAAWPNGPNPMDKTITRPTRMSSGSRSGPRP